MSFHKFNPFTGRIKQVTQTQALYPVLPSKLSKTEIPAMIYDSIKTKPVQTSVKRYQSTLNPKMAALYKKYQADLSKPTYLLAGTRDVILYRFTVAATVVSFAINMYYFVQIQKKF